MKPPSAAVQSVPLPATTITTTKSNQLSTTSKKQQIMAPPPPPPAPSTSNSCTMKQSLSMTSLPPNGQQEISEMAFAKLKFERPYNSLKKKRNSERDIWRHSWGSGHNSNSHSSCSLHSNATTNAGSGTGKDDFWAAIQTNYNYIMDTNLLDSCKEARCEIEGIHLSNEIQPENCYEKISGNNSRAQGSVFDIRSLRRWLREMENRISKAPTLTEAMKMKSDELQKRLRDHSIA